MALTEAELKQRVLDTYTNAGLDDRELLAVTQGANTDHQAKLSAMQKMQAKYGWSRGDLDKFFQFSASVRRGDKLEGSAYDQWINSMGWQSDAEIAAAGRPMQDLTAQIQQFIDTLRGPLNNDPVYQQISRQAVNAAQAQAGRAGMSGRSGMAATNAAAVTQTASAPYYAARQQALAGGLALQNQRDLGLGALQAQFDKTQNELATAKWAAQQNANQATGGAVGGTLGTVAGAFLAPYTGGMSMQVLPGAGAAAGAGLGGMGGSAAPVYRSGGGGGKNPYTGY